MIKKQSSRRLQSLTRIIAMGLALSLPTQGMAAWYTGTINRIQVDQAGNLVVFINAPTSSECGGDRVQYSAPNTQGMRTHLAALLAWEARAKTVQFLISSCAGQMGIFTAIEDTP